MPDVLTDLLSTEHLLLLGVILGLGGFVRIGTGVFYGLLVNFVGDDVGRRVRRDRTLWVSRCVSRCLSRRLGRPRCGRLGLPGRFRLRLLARGAGTGAVYGLMLLSILGMLIRPMRRLGGRMLPVPFLVTGARGTGAPYGLLLLGLPVILPLRPVASNAVVPSRLRISRVPTPSRLLGSSPSYGIVAELLVSPPVGVRAILGLNIPRILLCMTRIIPAALLIVLPVMVPVNVHPSNDPLNPTYSWFPVLLSSMWGIPLWLMQ